jgi:TRAP-type C4-dicarboxylate transport system permease small subunit
VSSKGLLEKANDWLQRCELVIICLCLVCILLAISANVISRTFNLRWIEVSELALLSMTVLTFIGSAYAVANRVHISIDLAEFFGGSKEVKQWLSWIADGVIAVTCVLLIVFGGDLLLYVIKFDERSSSLEMPLWIAVGSMWLGSVLSLFHLCALWSHRYSIKSLAAVKPVAENN